MFLISSHSNFRQSHFNTKCIPHALAFCILLFLTSYEVVQGGMVKAVLLNGAGKYHSSFCHVATFVSNLVTPAMDSDSNNDNIIRLVLFLNTDLVATEVQNPSTLKLKKVNLSIVTVH